MAPRDSGVQADANHARPPARSRRKPQVPPVSVFGPITGKPLARGQQQARKRVQQAQARLPARPVPAIPKIADPTRAQTQAALGLARGAQVRATKRPGQSGAQRNQAISDYLGELASDPRQQQYLKTAGYYTRVARRALEESVGRAGRKGLSRADAIRVGRAAIAAHVLADRVAPGRAHTKVGLPLATIDLTAASRKIGSLPGLSGGDLGPRSFVKNALGDVGALAEAPFVGGVAIGSAGLDLVHGRTAKTKALGAALAKGVTESAPAALVTGHPTLAGERFVKHPVIESLNFAAGVGAAGRAAGGLARGLGSEAAGSGVRGALARAGSTVRSPLALADDAGVARSGLLEQRTYSKDLTRKLAQRAADARRAPLRDSRGKVVTVTDRGRQVPVLRASAREREKLLKRRGDMDASRANSRERLARDAAAREESRTGRVARGKTGRVADQLLSMVVEGTLRSPGTLKADLERHAARIREQLREPRNYATKKERDAAAERAGLAERAARDPRLLAQAQRLFAVGHEHARLLNEGDAAAVASKTLPRAVAERSRLMTYAIEHMDARHVTVEEHGRLEAAARQVEEQARAGWKAAGPGEKAAAAGVLRRAREDRIAVSGRDPKRVAAHEQARGKLGVARARVRADKARLARAVQAQDAGRISAARARLDASNKDATKARHELASAPLPEARAALRTREGRLLSNEDIAAHARAAGRDPGTLAYLPHRLEAELNASHHAAFAPGTRPNFAKGETRTGALYRRGSATYGRDLVRDELTRKATQLAKTEQLDRQIGDVGLRHPAWAKAERGAELTKQEKRVVDRGGYFTGKEAVEYARRVREDTGEELIPVRAFAAKSSKETQAAIRGDQGPASIESLSSQLWNDRLNVKQGGARNVVLVPAAYATRLQKHLQTASEVSKFFQLLNGPFRMAVLPQPRWLTGNVLEPYFVRLPLSGSGVNLPGLAMDVSASRKILRAMEKGTAAEKRAAAELRSQQLGGLFVGRRGASNRRTFEDFSGRTRQALYGAHVVRNLPAVKQLGDLVLAVPKAFFLVNRGIESLAQHAALGKSVRRDVQEFTGSWARTVRLGDEAVREVKRGLVGTPTQQRFMRAQHELLGQYEGFSPVMRQLIQGPMPFLPWTLAAARFVFWTLPAHHTVMEAMLVQSSQAVASQWDAAHKDVPPGTLKLAEITKKGGLVDLARYTPFGFSAGLAEGDLQGLTDTLLPQISGTQAALQGKDPFGRDLQVPKTPGNPRGKASGGDKAQIAVNSFLEAMVPWLAIGRRLREKGGTGYATSTIVSPKVKPGSSHMSAARRTFDPFRPTYLKQPVNPAPAAGSGSGGSVEGPSDRAQQLLERAAEREVSGALTDRQLGLLERAAVRAGG